MRPRAIARLVAAAAALAACGDDAGREVSDAFDVAPDVEPLPDFSVAIEASTLTGNTPLTIDFEARAEGVALERLELRWIVDGVLAGTEPTLAFPFYRAGASTVLLQADLRSEAGDVKTAEATVNLTLLGCADLQLDRLTLEFPIDVPPGAALTIDVGRLRNEGDRIDVPFDVSLALSVDDRWDPELDRLLPGFALDGMASGLASESALDLAGRSFVLPADVVPGPYYVIAVADPGGVVNECQETNNHRVSTNSIVVDPGAGKLPDVVLEDLAIPAGTVVSQGRNLSYSFTLLNAGEAEARQFRYAFWVSSDPVLDRDSDRPIVLATDESARVQSMAPGFELGFFKSWRVPEDLPDGQWWIIGEVDATNVLAESDEGNNVAVSAVPFTMRYEAPDCYDFDLVAIEVAPLSTYWGGSVLLTATVANAGSQATPDGWLLRAYLSLTQTLSPQNAILVGTYALEGLAAGQTRSFEILVPISDDLPVIPHYLGVVIDPTAAFTECSEANNARLFPEPIKISALAEVDLSVSDFVFHPAAVQAGDAIKVEYQLGNGGTTAATTFQVGVVLSPDTTITRAGIAAGADVVVDRLTVSSLQPEEVRTVLRDVTIPAGLDHAVSEWVVAVMVDLDGFLSSDRSAANNLAVSDQRLVVAGANGGCFEDALEDNDSRAQAALVTRDDGARLTNLGSCGDEDWYLVDVPAGVSLAVDVATRPILSVPETPDDLVVELHDPAGAVVSRATLGPTYAPRAWAIAEPGAYRIRVAPATSRDRAAYDLSIRFLSPVPGIDVVPFEVVAAPAAAYAGGRLALIWREANVGTQRAPAHDTRLWLSRDRELQPTIDVLLGAGRVPEILPQATVAAETVVSLAATLQPGTWYAIVEADAGGEVSEVDEVNLAVGGPVALDPLKVCNDDAFEPNDEPIIATDLRRNGVVSGVSGAVVCPDLVDWYALDLEVGDAVEVDIDYAYESSKGRLVLELWAPDGQGAILTDARNGAGRVAVPYVYRAGRWLFRVVNDPAVAAQAPYTYEISASVSAGSIGLACGAERYEPNDGPTGAGAIGCGTTQAQLCNADVDWYTIPALAGQRLRVQAVNSAGQLLVQLTSPAALGASLATIYGQGSMDYTPTVSGPLYLKVTSRWANNGMSAFDYSLIVSGIDGADLLLEDMRLELAAVDRGEDVGVGFTVRNQCTLDAGPFEIAAWLSIDEVIDAGDLALLSVVAPGLAAADSFALRHKLTVPQSTAPGLYQVIVQVDSGDDVVEGNEIDNTWWLPIEIGEPCLADRFEPNDVQDQATALGAGEQIDLTVCPFDADWYAIAAPARADVTISALFSADDGDLDVRVYDPNVSATIPIATATSTDDDELVTVSTPLATTLYVRVSGYGGSAAPYDLVVDIER